MSSWLLSKRNYTRLAGILAGIGRTERNNCFSENVFHKWNYNQNRKYETEDFRDEIMSLYELNLVSFCKQYAEKEAEYRDTKEYLSDYMFYLNKGKEAYKSATLGDAEAINKLESLFLYINDFFSCVNYQIEDEECSEKANNIMNWYCHRFLSLLRELKGISTNWGDMDFFESENPYNQKIELSTKEKNVLDRLSHLNKTDCWFSIDDDNNCIRDLEDNNNVIDTCDAVLQVKDADSGEGIKHLSIDEYFTFMKLVDRCNYLANQRKDFDRNYGTFN